MTASPPRCVECGQMPRRHHKGKDGTLWCTEDGLLKGYGHYYGPAPSAMPTWEQAEAAGFRRGDSITIVPGVPLEGVKVCQVPENTGLHSDVSAIVSATLLATHPCDGCGAPAQLRWASPFDGGFLVCAECATAVA